MTQKTLKELYVDELRDLYDSEQQLIKSLPKMVKAANSDELSSGFEEHLEQTKGHVNRLEEICEQLDITPKGKKCAAMEGLIEEGKELMEEDAGTSILDAGLIAAAQKVEHYEIASYGSVRTWAEQLELEEVVQLLQETLDEEKETDEKLTQLAVSAVNEEADAGENDDDDEETSAIDGEKRGGGKR